MDKEKFATFYLNFEKKLFYAADKLSSLLFEQKCYDSQNAYY